MLIENFTNNYDVNNRHGDTSLLFLGGYKKAGILLKKRISGLRQVLFRAFIVKSRHFRRFQLF